MDAKRFDALARTLAGQASRRVMAGGLAAGALGGLVQVFGLPAAAAKRKNDRDQGKDKGRDKRNDKGNNEVAADKKRKKKITLCHSGQTITVSRKAKKKHLRHGDTVGPCPETPGCTPNQNPCAGRVCGTVDNGCGQQVSCGQCTAPEICTTTTGQCGCTPNQNPCGNRECGSVDNGCGQQVNCGSCTPPEVCNTNTGQCGCTPDQNPCGNRECGSVDNGCGQQVNCGNCTAPEICNTSTGECACTPNQNPCVGRECGSVDNGCGQQVSCGPNNGGCTGTDTCDTASGQCLPAACQGCNGCCTAEGICLAGNTDRQACGYGGGRCEACNPEVNCVNGECTCSNGISCGQGCCTVDENGRPACDNDLRPCGNTCIPRTACCTGVDASNRQIREGCLPNETCAVNSSGFGECRCGSGGRCQRNQGCCTLVNGQATCDTNLRPCGNICIDKTQCCSEGQVGCDDGVACTSETCQPATGTGQNPPPGICVQTFPNRICTETCAAGQGYGNATPENQREVKCAASGSVAGLPCYCWRTTEGDNTCTEDFYDAPACRTSADCASDRVCIRSGLVTGSNRCAPICR